MHLGVTDTGGLRPRPAHPLPYTGSSHTVFPCFERSPTWKSTCARACSEMTGADEMGPHTLSHTHSTSQDQDSDAVASPPCPLPRKPYAGAEMHSPGRLVLLPLQTHCLNPSGGGWVIGQGKASMGCSLEAGICFPLSLSGSHHTGLEKRSTLQVTTPPRNPGQGSTRLRQNALPTDK